VSKPFRMSRHPRCRGSAGEGQQPAAVPGRLGMIVILFLLGLGLAMGGLGLALFDGA
jgi:hypothetical protein